MTHLEIENIASEYLEGQLDTVRRSEVEQHLADCADCRELISSVRRAFELCRRAEPLEPPPWLVPKILRATIGERQPTFTERLAAWFRPVFQARVVYGVAMAVFSLSMIADVAGVNFRHVKARDLNPRNWVYQANRNGHLLLGRVEKYYYDLKVVYEIESRLRQLRAQPGEAAPQAKPPAGGSTEQSEPPDNSALASIWSADHVFQLVGQVDSGGWSSSARSTTP